MKKFIMQVVLLLLIFTLPSCSCKHEWTEATCVAASTCSLCGKIRGGVSDTHDWVEATCVSPKTCSLCKKTEGTASSTHSYVGDQCELCGVIQLTLYNYEDYIECDASVRGEYSDTYSGYLYTKAKCSFEAKGNVHFKYSDVSIVIKFSHYDKAGYDQYLINSMLAMVGKPIETEAIPYDDATYTVHLSIAGNGSKSCELYTPWSKDTYSYKDIDTVFSRTTYEIVSISGTVQEY